MSFEQMWATNYKHCYGYGEESHGWGRAGYGFKDRSSGPCSTPLVETWLAQNTVANHLGRVERTETETSRWQTAIYSAGEYETRGAQVHSSLRRGFGSVGRGGRSGGGGS